MPDSVFNILTLKRTKSSRQERESFYTGRYQKFFRDKGFRILEKKTPGTPHEMAAQIVGHGTSHKGMTYGRYGDRYSLGAVCGKMVRIGIEIRWDGV